MELQTAIEIVEQFQAWRLGKTDDFMHQPKTFTEALDVVLRDVKGNSLGAGSGSLPLESKLETFYDFLYERGIANQLGVGIDTVVKHFIDEKLSSNDR